MAVISPDDINQLVFAVQLRVGQTAKNAQPGVATENKLRRATSSVITTNVVHAT